MQKGTEKGDAAEATSKTEARTIWRMALRLAERWLGGAAKADALFQALSFQDDAQRRRCQHLFLGMVRWYHSTDALLREQVKRMPGRRLRALLHLATFELIEARGESGRAARVIDHAVGMTRSELSQRESGFVNAVLRKLSTRMPQLEPEAKEAKSLALAYSHPVEIVAHWLKTQRPEAVEAFLKWNQRVPEVYYRLRGAIEAETLQAVAEPTAFEGFYRVRPAADWAVLRALAERGVIYFQDPSTRHAPELLAPRPGEQVLDLCAAPGGKSLYLADLLLGQGQASELVTKPGFILSLDYPADDLRREQWRSNLAHLPREKLRRLEADARAITPEALEQHGFPPQYDAVLLDAPCSNSGVLRRRPDAKCRLSTESIAEMGALQAELLESAAPCVKPGGRLVYSTCSIEPEENEQLIEHFLKSPAGQSFSLRTSKTFRPPDSAHDGAGVFLLEKI